MSEIGERPQAPQPEQEMPQPRLEDMPEFQKLAPEQQQRVLEIRERIRNEAMDPKAVVSRSTNEMGFWEGMGTVVKPHLQKHKELYVKDLKAYASAALSLVPVLGEGKGLGSGLFGITVKKGEVVEKAIKFEPFVRGKKALEFGRKSYSYLRSYSAAEHLKNAYSVIHPMDIPVKVFHNATIFEKVGAKIHDAMRPIGAVIGGKTAVERSLLKDFKNASKEGAKVLSTKFGVEGVRAAQEAGKLAEKTAYLAKKAELTTDAIKNRHWLDLPKHWKAMGIERTAKRARKDAAKIAKGSMNMLLELRFKNRKLIPGQKWVESQAIKAVPKAIEATKFGKFHAFFDRWLNLTPDVPMWLSTTTGVMEFLGAHGIDAIPAVMQIAHNRYKQVMVTKNMALDVLKYTATRGLQKLAERKQAAEVFTQASAGAT